MTGGGRPALARRLGLSDAIAIGLGSMVGAGVFAAFAPAAAAAGTGLLVGLAIAAVIAFCNAAASAQLAAQYPTSGGTYVYGRERLGHWWGFLAGWGFVVGKTASCAAMAITFASYALPGPVWAQRGVAIVAVLVLTALNLGGITRTAAATKALVAVTLILLTVLVVGIGLAVHSTGSALLAWGGAAGPYGVLQSAGLLFFAFAGYARIATLGEEVRTPERTIPRAIIVALAAAIVIYVAVALVLLAALGPTGLAHAGAPLADAAHAAGVGALAPLARVGAAVASLGALLALITGVARTALAMARNRDLPATLDYVDERRQVPQRAELILALVVCLVVVTVDLRHVIGFSSFGVLIYYAVANAAATTQDRAHRRWPRALNLLGIVGCLTLVVALPWIDVVAGTLMFAVGVSGRWFVLVRRRGRDVA